MFFLSKELQAVCRNTGAKLGEASPSGGFLPRFLPGFWTYLGFFLKASETLNFGTLNNGTKKSSGYFVLGSRIHLELQLILTYFEPLNRFFQRKPENRRTHMLHVWNIYLHLS